MKRKNKHTIPLLSKQVRNALVRGATEYVINGTNETKPIGDLPWGAYFHAYRAVWNLSRPILLDKSPAFLSVGVDMASALRTHGHRAAFIVLSRSACTMSTKERPEFNARQRMNGSPLRLPNPQLHNYNRTAAMLIRTARALRQAGEHVMHIRYEDMMLHPADTVQRLLEFLPQLEKLDPTRNGVAGFVNLLVQISFPMTRAGLAIEHIYRNVDGW